MCVVSMIMDHYEDKWKHYVPQQPWTTGPGIYVVPPLTNEEINQIRQDAIELRKLLERAREYDRKNNEPDCELEEKRKKVKELAKLLGLGELDFV